MQGYFHGVPTNIHSLAVGTTSDPAVSRMTIVVDGDDEIVEQVEKQLNKLIDVITVKILTPGEFINRELILLKVNATSERSLGHYTNRRNIRCQDHRRVAHKRWFLNM